MRFDEALEEVGSLGFYQIILYFMMSAIMFMSADSIKMNFMAADVPHWCKVEALKNFSFKEQQYIAIPSEGSDGEYATCHRFPFDFSNISHEELLNWNRTERTSGFSKDDWVACDDGWTYDRWQFAETINSKWDLVCGQSILVQIAGTIFMAGRLLGSLSTGIADRIGRKPTANILNGLKVVGGLLASFLPYYPAFVMGRFLIGVGSIGGQLVCFVLLTEIVNSERRSFIGFLWLVQFSFGYCLICGVAYYVRDYVNLQIIYTFPMLFTFILLYSMDESPRWLVSQGRDEEAITVLNKMAKINGKPPLEIKDFKEERQAQAKIMSERKPNLADLFQTPNMRFKTIVMYIDWFTTSFVYYGLSLNSGTLAGDLFLNTFLMGVVEVPAKAAAWILLDVPKLGRRNTLAGALIFGGVANLLCIPLFYIENTDAGLTTLAIMGKVGSTIGFSGVYVVAAELFPTTLRNVGVGSSSMCSRIANLATPYMGTPMMNVWVALPSVIFGGLAVGAGTLTFTLPETLNTKLPETVEEAEDVRREPCVCCNSELPHDTELATVPSNMTGLGEEHPPGTTNGTVGTHNVLGVCNPTVDSTDPDFVEHL